MESVLQHTSIYMYFFNYDFTFQPTMTYTITGSHLYKRFCLPEINSQPGRSHYIYFSHVTIVQLKKKIKVLSAL